MSANHGTGVDDLADMRQRLDQVWEKTHSRGQSTFVQGSALMEVMLVLRKVIDQLDKLSAIAAGAPNTPSATESSSGSTCEPTGPERKSLVEMVEESNRRPVSGWDDKGQRQKGKT